jgi:tellurite methyltransferase
MSTADYWDSMYSLPERYRAEKPSAEVVAAAVLLSPGARIIDIGCGDGRNVIFLAAQGFQVTAVDIAPAAIAKTQQIANEHGLKITGIVQDMRALSLDGDYNLIVSTGCLHMIERPAWQTLLQQMQTHTSVGGYHAIGIMTDALPAPADLREQFIGIFHPGELRSYYTDWEIISERNEQFHDEHPNGARHHHAAERILARRK